MNRLYCYMLFIVVLVLAITISACRKQNTAPHFTIVLEDGVAATSQLDKPSSPLKWGKYHPRNICDGNKSTCWCEGDTEGYGIGETVYFSVPWHADTLAIHNGYQKSNMLYMQNSRVKKAEIKFYVAVAVEGHATQTGVEYSLFSTNEKINVALTDTMDTITIPLTIDYSRIVNMAHSILKNNQKHPVHKPRMEGSKNPIAAMRLVASLTIKEVYPGSRYTDTCISEISFPFTKKPVANQLQNTITVGNHELVSDTHSVFQILDISPDNYWAIVIRMPAIAHTRVETEYRLYYLPGLHRIMVDIDSQSLIGFTDIHGKPVKNQKNVYLQFIDKAGREDTRMLNPYNLLQFL